MSPPRIGVLYTGGTIGMAMRDGSLAPSGALAASLTRRLRALHGDSLDWQVATLDPVIDSADASPQTWHAIARGAIALADAGCAGVLVLHGTDTLAYSAAALAFLLHGLPVPVVLTGSMKPATDAGTDAWANVQGAVALLRQPGAQGVRLCFGGRALHPLRSRKWTTEDADAFRERTLPPQPAPRAVPPWSLRQAWAPRRTAALSLHPGFAPELLDALREAGVAGCVLGGYGNGTAPTGDARFLAALARARAAGMVLVVVSQCPEGRVVSGQYEAGRRLREAGVIDGGAMGVEAALAKLHALLAAGLDAEACSAWMARDLCGEL